MPQKYKLNASATEQRERRRREKAEMKALADAKLRARNMELLMGIGPDDRPFWPGCSVRLSVGAIRSMRRIDSVLSRRGMLGDLVASRSSYVLDIPNYSDVTEWLQPRAQVEFIVGSSNRVLGVRKEEVEGEPSWTFIVTLTREAYDRVHAFAMKVDPEQHAWSSPAVTVEIRCGAISPILSEGMETVNFVGLVSSLKLGAEED